MAIKFETPEGAAYEVARGISREEAAEAGLAIVEYNYGTVPPSPVFGRYKDAPGNAPLGITVDKPGDSQVIGGGGVAAPPPEIGGGKGDAFRPTDPIARPLAGQTMHADNSPPGVVQTDPGVSPLDHDGNGEAGGSLKGAESTRAKGAAKKG